MSPAPGKGIEHLGIRIQLIGDIELASERGSAHEFVSLGTHAACRLLRISIPPAGANLSVLSVPVRELCPPGNLQTQQVLPFDFQNVELQYDTYRGMHARLR